jgi:hypothetical protein
MLVLFEQFWPWIAIGTLLTYWGWSLLGTTFAIFLRAIVDMLFMPFSDDTKKEKQLAAEPMEEVVSANPGCIILLAGVVMVIFGLLRWVT